MTNKYILHISTMYCHHMEILVHPFALINIPSCLGFQPPPAPETEYLKKYGYCNNSPILQRTNIYPSEQNVSVLMNFLSLTSNFCLDQIQQDDDLSVTVTQNISSQLHNNVFQTHFKTQFRMLVLPFSPFMI